VARPGGRMGKIEGGRGMAGCNHAPSEEQQRSPGAGRRVWKRISYFYVAGRKFRAKTETRRSRRESQAEGTGLRGRGPALR
jgi:hypothetical protein